VADQYTSQGHEAVAGSGVLAPNGAVLLQSMLGVAWLYLLTFYFQDVRGVDPLVSGLWFAPMTVASVIGAVVAGRATVWVGTRATAMAGLLILGGSVFVIALAVASSGGFVWSSPAWLLAKPDACSAASR
jgi:MFS family permease